MSDAVREEGVRGEYNKTFSPENVRVGVEGEVVFCAPGVQRKLVLLKGAKTILVDGKAITDLDEYAQFEDFLYRTSDAEMADKLRAHKAFKRGVIVELSKIRAEAREKNIQAKAKELSEDPELLKAALAALKQGKSAAPEVTK